MSSKVLILVVEDDPLIGADLSISLSNYGYEVLGPVASGEQALEEIKTSQVSLILMDINLAGELDGIKSAELAQGIRAIPVVFLSALSDEATLQRAKLVNPFGFLIKPFDAAELRATIELTLQRFNREIAEQGLESNKLSQILEPYEQTGAVKDQILHYLTQFSIFKSIPSEALAQLSNSASIKSCEAGEFLAHEGEESPGVFIPFSGRVSVTKTTEAGKELIVALLAPGDPFGLIYALPAFSGTSSARTQIASNAIWIPQRDWLNFCQQNPVMNHNLANILAERLAASHALSSSLAHAKVEDRIIKTLSSLIADFGKLNKDNLNQQRIYITRKELAELTGTTPETAIRVTKSLERFGMLDLARPGIIKIIDIAMLKEAVLNPSSFKL